MSQLLRQAKHLLATGQFTDAEALCRQVLTTSGPAGLAKKVLAEILYNQGVMLSQRGMFNDAEERYHAALKENPKHALAWNNLALQAFQAGRTDEAIDGYKKALAAVPVCIEAAQNLATALQYLDRLDEAYLLFEKLEKLDPSNAGMYFLRKATLIRGIMPDADYPDRVRSTMSTLLDKCLVTKQRSTSPERLAVPYFFLSYHGKPNRELHEKIARSYLHICPSLEWHSPHVGQPRDGGSKIRLGIASANLFNHSIGATTCGLVQHLDKNRFEVVVIRFGPSPNDATAALINAAASQVIWVPTTNLGAARDLIASLKLDILFYQDIGMEAFSYLLSFARLAPIQLTSFGHPDTTGVSTIDYFISSDLYEPENGQEHYSERLLTIPNAGTLSYYYRPTPPSDRVLRAEFGLDETEHIYLCPQTLFKIHTDMDSVFAEILTRDPKARIVFIEPSKAHYRHELEARWQKILRIDGITFIKRMSHKKYMRLLSCADVMLDTAHFNGQNTNLEAFSVGLPVVTWPSMMQRGRHTLGMYKRMGKELFTDLIATDAADYAKKAVHIATDPELRLRLVSAIEANRSDLYEDMNFVRSCEALFIKMVHQETCEDREQKTRRMPIAPARGELT